MLCKKYILDKFKSSEIRKQKGYIYLPLIFFSGAQSLLVF